MHVENKDDSFRLLLLPLTESPCSASTLGVSVGINPLYLLITLTVTSNEGNSRRNSFGNL